MLILHQFLKELKSEFAVSRKGEERGTWFVYTLLAIIVPFTSSKTSNLLRCLKALFGFSGIPKKRYYTFMASSKIPWHRLWRNLWEMIPEPLTDGKLIVALDDYINPKTGKKVFGCSHVFDHAAKQNQSKYPWAQNIVSIGLLKIIKGRWAFLPLNFRFYHLKKVIEKNRIMIGKKEVQFQTKLQQSADMLIEIANAFPKEKLLTVTDTWFGNKGLWKPVRDQLGERFNMVSRLRINTNLFDLPPTQAQKKAGRPRKYGAKLGNATSLANKFKGMAKEYTVNLYGKMRTVSSYDQVVMLRTLKCQIRVVWIYRKTQWVALFSTDLSLSVEEIIEYYGARWKIESGFKELKRDIGSADTQSRNPHAVMNHLHFCMMASSLTWMYASRLAKAPNRRHAVTGRRHYAFSDVRRLVAQAALDDNFGILFPVPRKSVVNYLVDTLLRMAA